jgi:peptide deformylase
MSEAKALPLVYYPDKRLRQISEQAKPEELKHIFDQLIATCRKHQSLGVAAVQVGIMKAMFVVDHDYIVQRYFADQPNKPKLLNKLLCIANPVFLEKSSEMQEIDDGCLSLPGRAFAKTHRAARIKIKYLDYDGQEQILEAEGLLAGCIQHEYDHTIGKLFIDYLSPLKREMVIKKVEKYLKQLRAGLINEEVEDGDRVMG